MTQELMQQCTSEADAVEVLKILEGEASLNWDYDGMPMCFIFRLVNHERLSVLILATA